METVQDQFSFIYGDEAIPYKVFWKSDCKAEKITIKVHPNSEVIVNALEGTNTNDIHQALMKRARWVWQSLQEFRPHQSHKVPKQYRSGEMMFYLGRRYVLKLIEGEGKPTVKLTRGQLQVNLPDSQKIRKEYVQDITQKWYREHAHRIFKDRLKALTEKTDWVKEIPPFKIMAMQKQWGSCSIQGCLMLNPHLIKAPKECIDYVILHELCHIAEHNHSDRFWKLLTQVMPDWKERKSKLDGMAEYYLN